MTAASGSTTFPSAAEICAGELAEIDTILNMRRNFSLSVYKDACIKRRIAIRIRATRSRDAAEYCRLLRQSEQEQDLLQKVLTIHVSQFFRNPSMFEKLRVEVLPGLFVAAQADPARTLRLWCLGCAGGEEPYSLAILLREHFSRELRRIATTIAGTDIDAESLDSARRGEYGEDRLKEVSTELREHYFRPHQERQRLTPEIREMVTFTQGNISRTDQYPAANLVLCRNTLIYFSRPEQEKILDGIAEILPTGGVLVLGKSETLVGATRRRFSPVCRIERIYRKL
jgi:chemotaxis protein methyltransferase CheR